MSRVTIDSTRKTVEYPIGMKPHEVLAEVKEAWVQEEISQLDFEWFLDWYLEKHHGL